MYWVKGWFEWETCLHSSLFRQDSSYFHFGWAALVFPFGWGNGVVLTSGVLEENLA